MDDEKTMVLTGDGIDTSQYYVVRKGEYDDMKAEIERLRVEKMAIHAANHEAMWDDTLIPIANALGVSIDDDHGVPRRHFQMVEAIIKETRRG